MATLKELMEGKPLRSPLHPAIVHLPIAFLPLSVILDVASRIIDSAEAPLAQASFLSLLIGIATALLAAVFGFVDYTDIRHDHPARKTATAHMLLNLIAVGLFAASAGLRFGTAADAPTPVLPLLLSVVALVVLSYSGYLGGILVYDDGIAVGRHRRRTRTPETTLTFGSGDKPTPIAVAAADAIKDGETLRVSIDGVVITIARCGDEVFAVQEFCTHRFGPLSEGRIAGCVVTCPWHNSKFDLKTGKVTRGPAKIDLRTFAVDVRDGRIWVTPPPK